MMNIELKSCFFMLLIINSIEQKVDTFHWMINLECSNKYGINSIEQKIDTFHWMIILECSNKYGKDYYNCRTDPLVRRLRNSNTMTLKNTQKYPNGYRESNGDYRTDAILEDPNVPLYKYQKSLPRLPVPPLKETCELYLKTVQPLVSAKAFQQTQLAVQEFVNHGMGTELQNRLLKRASDRQDTSYLAEWWNTLGYLQVRDPVVFNVSYFFHFMDSFLAEDRTQTGRAASLIESTLSFREKLVQGTLDAECLGNGKTPLCSTAYKYFFNSCRIPKREQDSFRIYDPSENNHIVVLRHNKFFQLNTLENGKHLTRSEIQYQLDQILSSSGGKESPIGVLTSLDRDQWSDAREQLLQDGNASALKIIESAILVLCLDDTSPVARDDVARGLWHGDGRNRFYDKGIQLIVFENGKAGLLGEHSMSDGMPVVAYADYILRDSMKRSIVKTPCRHLSSPSKIEFKFTRPTMDAIAKAEKLFDATVEAHEVSTEVFYGYGKSGIKQFKCSPDAFIQMAIQLAYRKLFKTTRATYEATQVRPYLHGRTETTRTVSIELKEWTDAMMKNPGVPTLEKVELLRKAIQSHVKYMKRAATSSGVDRHLLGLKLCLQPGEKATIFEDPSYSLSKHWTISTSHLTHELFDGWGWGEVVPDGLGVAYSIKDESCHFNVASQKNNWVRPFCHCVEESLLEMKTLFDLEKSKQSKL